jgi:hypothetical protein
VVWEANACRLGEGIAIAAQGDSGGRIGRFEPHRRGRSGFNTGEAHKKSVRGGHARDHGLEEGVGRRDRGIERQSGCPAMGLAPVIGEQLEGRHVIAAGREKADVIGATHRPQPRAHPEQLAHQQCVRRDKTDDRIAGERHDAAVFVEFDPDVVGEGAVGDCHVWVESYREGSGFPGATPLAPPGVSLLERNV